MDQLETWLCLLVHAGSSAHWASLRNRMRIPVNEGLRMIARASLFVHQLAPLDHFTLAGATELQAPRVNSQRKNSCTQTNQIIAKMSNPAREKQSSLQLIPP
jgi:hypothetical protein